MDRRRTQWLLRGHEGVRNVLYKDSKGIETFGIGHNAHEPISEAAISQIFQDDLTNVLGELNMNFSWFSGMDDVRQAAIIDMVFNMGMPTFSEFRKTIGFMEAGDYWNASKEILRGSGPGGMSRYYADVGVRAERISQKLETGEWV